MAFFHILVYNMLPLLCLSAIGYWLDAKFEVDVKTLTKITFYIVLPAFVFKSIYEMRDTSDRWVLLIAGSVLLVAISLCVTLFAYARHYDSSMKEIFRNCAVFNNCGNVGVAMVTLIYTHPPYAHGYNAPYYTEAMATITMLLILINISVNTIGLYQVGKSHMTARDAIRMVFHMPTVYVVAGILLLKYFHVPVDTWFIWPTVKICAACLPFIAMTTLGIQLHRTDLYWFDVDVWAAILFKLVLSPILALIIIYSYGKFDAITAQVFLIFSGVPSAVNSVMFAVDFDNHPGFATQAVMLRLLDERYYVDGVDFLGKNTISFTHSLMMWIRKLLTTTPVSSFYL